MPQGTVKSFDVESWTGTVVTDDQTEIAFDRQTFTRSGLRELRLGQRVRFELTDSDDGGPRLRSLQLVSL